MLAVGDVEMVVPDKRVVEAGRKGQYGGGKNEYNGKLKSAGVIHVEKL